MRMIWIAIAAAAALGLAGCGEASDQAATPPAPAPKKSLARSVVFYQGQGQVQSLTAGSIAVGADGALQLTAEAVLPGPGYGDTGFEPRIYAAPPPDGIYEVDVVATEPKAPTGETETKVTIKGAWPGYKKERLKGVKMFSKTNEIVAMLPAG